MGSAQRTAQFSWNYIECTKSYEGDEAKEVGLVCAESLAYVEFRQPDTSGPLGMFE